MVDVPAKITEYTLFLFLYYEFKVKDSMGVDIKDTMGDKKQRLNGRLGT